MSDEPPRLLDASESAALRDALKAARSDGPDAAQIARMRERLPRGAPPTGGGHALPWKLALPLVAAVAVVAVALARSPAPRPVTPPPPPPPVVVPAPAVIAAAPVAPLPPPRVEAPPAPRPVRVAPARGAHAVIAEVDAGATVVAECDEAAESGRLQSAQTALRDGRWSAVLAACADDERACAGGPLSEERERLWIEALVRAGRDAEARSRWGRFERRYPGSPYGERLRALWPDEAR